MQIKIPEEVHIQFTGKGITYVLDVLSGQPFKDVNGLINDILGQLKRQEEDELVFKGENDGPNESS